MTHGPSTRQRRHTTGNDDENTEEIRLPTPPDGGWGWMVVFASFMIHIVTDGVTYSFGIFYAEFLTQFGEGKAYTSWIASILVGVTLCSGPISSAFVNRYGCRAVTIAGAILASLFLIASVFAKDVATLIFTIGIGTGFGFGLIYLPAIVSVTMYFERLRSLATGIAVCGSGLGTFIFAPVIEKLIAQYGWEGALLTISGIVFCCIIFGAMFRPLKPDPQTNDHVPQDMNNLTPKLQEDTTYATNNNLLTPLQRSHSIGHEIASNGNNNNNNNNKKSSTSNSEISRLALSQPLLSSPEHHASGTMYRPDILYQGSVNNISRYHSRCESIAIDSDKYGSMRKTDYAAKTKAKDGESCGCVPCSKETKDTFSEMMNFSLLTDPIFIIFIVSNFLTSIGFNVPYVYLVTRAESLDIPKNNASYLLSIIGIANTVGRIVLGYLSDKPWVNRLFVYNVCLTLCGLVTAFSVLCLDFISLAVYSSIFGFTIGAYVGLTSVILVDLLGLDKLTNAFGLLLLFQGIASFIGPPLAGLLFDLTLSYNPGFILAGVTIALSGIMLFSIKYITNYMEQKECKKDSSEMGNGLNGYSRDNNAIVDTVKKPEQL